MRVPLFDPDTGKVIDREGLRSTARGLGNPRHTHVELLADTRTQRTAERHHLPDGSTRVHVSLPTAEVVE